MNKKRKEYTSKPDVDLSIKTLKSIAKYKSTKYIENNKEVVATLESLNEDDANKLCEIINKRKKDQHKDNIVVKTYLDLLRHIRGRYDGLVERSNNPFGGSFDNFVNWWFLDKHGNTTNGIGKKNVRNSNGSKVCFYCGISEEELVNVFNNPKVFKKINETFKPGTYHESKAGNKWNNPSLEIDKLDPNPNTGYKMDNCVFACHLCNNAKTDIIEAGDFIKNVAPGFKKYYKTLKGD